LLYDTRQIGMKSYICSLIHITGVIVHGVTMKVVNGDLLDYAADAIAISVGPHFELKGKQKCISSVLNIGSLWLHTFAT